MNPELTANSESSWNPDHSIWSRQMPALIKHLPSFAPTIATMWTTTAQEIIQPLYPRNLKVFRKPLGGNNGERHVETTHFVIHSDSETFPGLGGPRGLQSKAPGPAFWKLRDAQRIDLGQRNYFLTQFAAMWPSTVTVTAGDAWLPSLQP